MKVQTKLMVLLFFTFLLFTVAILAYFFNDFQQKKLVDKTNRENAEFIIDNILFSKGEKYSQIAFDYSCWDEMVDECKIHDSVWCLDNVSTSINTYDFSFFMIRNIEGELVFIAKDTALDSKEIFFSKEYIKNVFRNSKNVHFYVYIGDKLFEIFGSIVVPTTDEKQLSGPQGYVLIGKQWDVTYIKEIEHTTNSKITILPIAEINKSIEIQNNKKLISINRHIKDFRENVIAEIIFSRPNPIAKEQKFFITFSAGISVLVVILMIVFFVFLHQIIHNPISKISASLNSQEIRFIEKMKRKKDEFGQIARLIDKFFRQKQELKQSNETLILQKEEILAQKDELEEITQELSAKHNELEFQNAKIIEQKDEIEHKASLIFKQNDQIKSSIKVAFTIQQAFLPSEMLINNYFDCFIIFEPKDIISGDFYWFTRVQQDSKLIFYAAVVDCTGHGVPGAFMTMLANQILNETVIEKQISEPKYILQTVDKQIIRALRQDEKENNDGMDICLCRIDNSDSQINVCYAGAERPLYYFDSKNKTNVTYEADLWSVGGLKSKTQYYFTQKDILCSKGDILYLTSDGFVDQNSPCKSKFGSNAFVGFLEKIAHLPLESQKIEFTTCFDNWKQNSPQRDDITLFGLKL